MMVHKGWHTHAIEKPCPAELHILWSNGFTGVNIIFALKHKLSMENTKKYWHFLFLSVTSKLFACKVILNTFLLSADFFKIIFFQSIFQKYQQYV